MYIGIFCKAVAAWPTRSSTRPRTTKHIQRTLKPLRGLLFSALFSSSLHLPSLARAVRSRLLEVFVQASGYGIWSFYFFRGARSWYWHEQRLLERIYSRCGQQKVSSQYEARAKQIANDSVLQWRLSQFQQQKFVAQFIAQLVRLWWH